MIAINNKQDCCGCSACFQKCPKHCISMNEDEEGFLYPKVDANICVDCHQCEKVCPVINQSDKRYPENVYAATNKNGDTLLRSSSGGIFSLLAEKIINDGGVVFGAAFDKEWIVKHTHVDTLEDLKKLQGSKYVQSDISDSYISAEDYLKIGRKVLFSGTPCQIAGLKKYLRKEYDNLLTVDVICHGSPSPGIWRDYLTEITERPKGFVGKNTVLLSLKEKPVITGISFRDKADGWKKFSFVIRGKSASMADKNTVLSSDNDYLLSEPASKNFFMRGFLNNIYLRPSCYSCPARCGKSGSDLLLGDFWGILRRHPEFYDPNGVSLVLAYTDKGKLALSDIDCKIMDATYDDALDCNISIEENESIPSNRTAFFKAYSKKGVRIIDKYCKQLEPSKSKVYTKIIQFKLKRILHI